jgi:hypothetical protein
VAELFSPTEKWYSAQMERRTADSKARDDAVFSHHNLAFDNDDDVDGNKNMELKRLKYKNEAAATSNGEISEEKITPPPPYQDLDGNKCSTSRDAHKTAQMEEIESLPEALEVQLEAAEIHPPKPVETIDVQVIEAVEEEVPSEELLEAVEAFVGLAPKEDQEIQSWHVH